MGYKSLWESIPVVTKIVWKEDHSHHLVFFHLVSDKSQDYSLVMFGIEIFPADIRTSLCNVALRSCFSMSFEDDVKRTVLAIANQFDSNQDVEFRRQRIVSTLALHDRVKEMEKLQTSAEKKQAIEEFNGRYNSAFVDKDDGAIGPLIESVNHYLTPEGVATIAYRVKEIAPYMSDTFTDASGAYSVASEAMNALPESKKSSGLFVLQSSLDIASEVAAGLAWVFDKVPDSDYMVNKVTLSKIDSAIRSEFTQQILEMHQTEEGQATLKFILEDSGIQQNSHVADTIKAINEDPSDLVTTLNLSAAEREVLQRAIDLAATPADTVVTSEKKTEQFLSTLNHAVEKLRKGSNSRLSIEQDPNKDIAQKAKEKDEIIRQVREQDSAVYIASTLFGRTGNEKVAKSIDVSYKAYKQLSFLAGKTVEEYGAASMTAGYVGVALMLSDNLLSSGKPSAEQQMMAEIRHMFEALQAAIKDFREETIGRLDGLANGQLQILNAIDEAANRISANVNSQFADLRADMDNVYELVRRGNDLLQKDIIASHHKTVSDSLAAFRRAASRGMNDQRMAEVIRSLTTLAFTATDSSYPGPHQTAYTGNKALSWDASTIISALNADVFINPHFHVGVIPAIVHGLRDRKIMQIPNPSEWMSTVNTLLAGYYQFPEVARSVEENQGHFLKKIGDIAKILDQSTAALLEEKTLRAALQRYKKMAGMFIDLVDDINDEIVVNEVMKGVGSGRVSSDGQLAELIKSIGRSKLPQYFPYEYSAKEIKKYAKKNPKWSDGRLDITSPALREFNHKNLRGPLKRDNDATYIKRKNLNVARDGLLRKASIPNAVFMNEDYDRYRVDGSHHHGKHAVKAEDGRTFSLYFRNRIIHINSTFEVNYDILKLARRYGLLKFGEDKKSKFRALMTARSGRRKAVIYGEMYKNHWYQFTTGNKMKFSLRHTKLVAVRDPAKPIVSSKQEKWIKGISESGRRFDLSHKIHRLAKPISNFGTLKVNVHNSTQLVQALHEELYSHQRHVKQAVIESVRRLVDGSEYSEGTRKIGLSKPRYKEIQKKIQLLVDDMSAVAAAMRYMSSMGIIANGLSIAAATDTVIGRSESAEDGRRTQFRELPETSHEILRAFVHSARTPVKPPIDATGVPVDYRTYVRTSFVAAIDKAADQFYAQYLSGLENSNGLGVWELVNARTAGFKHVH